MCDTALDERQGIHTADGLIKWRSMRVQRHRHLLKPSGDLPGMFVEQQPAREEVQLASLRLENVRQLEYFAAEERLTAGKKNKARVQAGQLRRECADLINRQIACPVGAPPVARDTARVTPCGRE